VVEVVVRLQQLLRDQDQVVVMVAQELLLLEHQVLEHLQ
jgi:hypothetical protein